jgi:hypothetical protein
MHKNRKYVLLVLLSLCVLVAVVFQPFNLPFQQAPLSEVVQNLPSIAVSPTPLSKASISSDSAGLLADDVKFHAFFATPISFYGKVIDQSGQAVSDADVKLGVNDKPWEVPTIHRKLSDSNGMFSFHGLKGLALDVDIKKAGYHRVIPRAGKHGSYGSFAYRLNQGEGLHVPDPKRPTVFVLRKPEVIEPLLQLAKRRPRIPKDGTRVRLQLYPDDNDGWHYLDVQCWTDDENRTLDGRHDWKLKLSVPNGGLLPYEGDDHEAPETGYQPSFEHDMPKTLGSPKWRRSFESKFFVRFNDGVHTRIVVNMGSFGAHYLVYSGYTNPKAGSRNLDVEPLD